jgi:hypothetical protein
MVHAPSAGMTRLFLSVFIRGGEAASVFIRVFWHEGSRYRSARCVLPLSAVSGEKRRHITILRAVNASA